MKKFSGIQFAPLVWFFVIAYIILVFFPSDKEILVFPDGNFYINQAYNVFAGNGYIEVDHTVVTREPGFPYLLAWVFTLGNPSTLTAYLFVRLFFVGNLILIYLLTREISQSIAPLVVLLLLISTPALNYWQSYIHIDHVILFFLLLDLWLVIRALRSEKYIYFILAGIAIGVSYLLKIPNTLAILPVLFLLALIKEFRTVKNLKGWGVLIVSSLIIVGPWLIYVSGLQGEIYIRGTTDITSAVSSGNSADIWWTLLTLGPTYYLQYLQPNFTFAFLLVVSFVYAFAKLYVTKSGQDKIIAAVLLGVVPLMFFLVEDGQRARQSQFIFFILYMVWAIFIVDLARFLGRFFPTRPYSQQIIPTIILLPIIAIQIFVPPPQILNAPANYTMLEYVADFNIFSLWQNSDQFTWRNSQYERYHSLTLAKWMLQNIPTGAAIAFDNESQRRSLYVPTDGRYRLFKLLTYSFPGNNRLPFTDDTVVSVDIADLTNNFGNELVWRSQLATLNSLKSNDIDYVVETDPIMAVYFLEHPSFLMVYDTGEEHIFQVVGPLTPISFTNYISSRLEEEIREDTEIAKLAENFFLKLLNSSVHDFQLLPRADNQTQQNDIISIFARRQNQLGVETLEKTSLAFAQRDKQTVWSTITQAYLKQLLATATTDTLYAQQAAELYEQAFSEAMVSPDVYAVVWKYHLSEYILLGEIDNNLIDIDLLDKIARQAERAEVWYIVADVHHAQGEIEQAIEGYQQAIAIEPNKIYLIQLGRLYMGVNNFSAAAATLQSGRDLYPDDIRFYLGLGQAYLNTRDYKQALNAYETAVAMDPTNYFASIGVADTLRLAGNYEKAIDTYLQIIGQFPSNINAYVGLADAYALTNNAEKAMATYQQVIEMDKSWGRAYIGLGQIYESQNRLQEAAQVYKDGLMNVKTEQEKNRLSALINRLPTP